MQVRRIQELEALLRDREDDDDRREDNGPRPGDRATPEAIVASAFAGVVATAGGIPPLDTNFDGKFAEGDGYSDDDNDGDSIAPRAFKSVRFASPYAAAGDGSILSPTAASRFEGIVARLGGHRHTASAPAHVHEAAACAAADGSRTAADLDVTDLAASGADVDVTDAVQRAEAEFARRETAMERNIKDYERTIALKEDRLRSMQVS